MNPEFNELFDEMLKSRVDHLARQPEDLETLVEAVTLYHMVIEGMLALTGQHFILQYNEEQGTLPGFVEGFNKIARDEHRHVAFGARFLREMAQEDNRYARGDHRARSPRSARSPTRVLRPSGTWRARPSCSATDLEETRAFAAKALERRLKVIGLAPRGLGHRGRVPLAHDPHEHPAADGHVARRAQQDHVAAPRPARRGSAPRT